MHCRRGPQALVPSVEASLSYSLSSCMGDIIVLFDVSVKAYKNSEVGSYLGKHHISLYSCYAVAKSADSNAADRLFLGTPIVDCQFSNC